MRLAFFPLMLRFKFQAGTSRGVLNDKFTLLLKFYDEKNPQSYGIGEAALFPGLSPEADNRYQYKVMELMANVAINKPTDLSEFPSLQFGFEQALRDFASGGKGIYFDSPFLNGQEAITINGLIWMGKHDEMKHRLLNKLDQGFKCIKFKIGAINWEEEIELIKFVRQKYSPDEVTVRVDANGAFTPENVMPKLNQLAELGVHSIEQPIKPRNYEALAKICAQSPVPIALDEELIGLFHKSEKIEMLDIVKPHYLILKPALIGGFSGAEEWINLAEERGIGWWVTSALESNVGLNAIAQWTATLNTRGLPQGLGTGGLFLNNTPSQLILDGQNLRFNPLSDEDKDYFNSLDWHE